jgi:hypothetical protein
MPSQLIRLLSVAAAVCALSVAATAPAQAAVTHQAAIESSSAHVTTVERAQPTAVAAKKKAKKKAKKVKKKWKLIKTYRGDGNWQSPTIRIKKRDYKAQVTYRCTDPSGGFLYLTWSAEPYYHESANSSRAQGTVTLYGHDGGRRGYFEISSWIDCYWKLKVYQAAR